MHKISYLIKLIQFKNMSIKRETSIVASNPLKKPVARQQIILDDDL